MRKRPKFAYAALDEDNDVVGVGTNKAELEDEASGRWATILRYRDPEVCATRRRRTDRRPR